MGENKSVWCDLLIYTLYRGYTPIEYVKGLKNSEGGDIWLCGGGKLAGSLFENNLIEKLTLKINPVIFGAGKHLFENSKKSGNFRLLSSRKYNNGVILSKYEIEKTHNRNDSEPLTPPMR